MATVRAATEVDAAAVQAIYAPYILDTAISFEIEVPSAAEMAARIGRVLPTHAWLVCEDGAGMAGYAYASRHSERAAYDWSVDVSVYVAARAHRAGVGRGLYTALLAQMRLLGHCNAYGGITLPNDASVGLHKAMGFQPVGVYESVGYKFGRWHDVAWLSLRLQPLPEAPAQPRRPADLSADPAWQAARREGERLVRL